MPTATEANDRVKAEVQVAYNGRPLSFPYKPTELVAALLASAIQAFGVVQNPHLLSLFDEEAAELKEDQSLAKAKVKRGEHLILRPSVVKGG